ncbi:MAG: carbon storage regulator CsrA [Treponema porcinum]|uniref:Translational regulator CsrA n=1 Tax=Treponema porcinum TaxID=261392 RepID=A0A1T4KBA0_TREPO|nr:MULTISPECIES: carbon storage regulator CsrA [Treponema]MCI5645454.1 carbon storage regulator CsrA [Treponema porcinum]MCI6180539.1 carbon storage regulator CsrA [Treponema porcinum]MCI6322874.1 carbon storage regulator CsrA [Treponema porcinum]MCI6482684.1 carbon storage regulator CsrA [Treponema porcinum]MCI6722145.1 carbon storage regulator CsrA [Treponema porcinum]
MLILSRKTDQQIKIGDDITLTIIEIRGDQVKIGVEAPKSIKVFRQEVFSAIKSENTAALNVNTDSIGALSKMLTH